MAEQNQEETEPTTESPETETEETESEETESEETESEESAEPDKDALLAQEREQRIRLEERLKAQTEQGAKPKEEPPKRFTRAQLRAAVSEGTIDEDQMEEIWVTQERREMRREMEEVIEQRDRKRSTITTVESETAKYLEVYPELRTEGSPTWNKVKEEFDFLVRLGDDPADPNGTTQLKALRAALGRADQIKESTGRRRQTAQETSSSQSGGGGGGRPVDIWNQVPQQYRSHYKRMVDEGLMTLEGVKKDIPYMKRLSS